MIGATIPAALVRHFEVRANLGLFAARDRQFTPIEQRQLEKLTPHIDCAAENDRAFFERHPHRKHRVRFTTDAEIARFEIACNDVLQPPHGFHWFTLVRNDAEALRQIFTVNRGDAATGLDVPEDQAELVFVGVAVLLWQVAKMNGGGK
jgi:hypothetical protein